MNTQEKELSIDELMKKIKEEVANRKQKQDRESFRNKNTDADRVEPLPGKIISFNKKDTLDYKNKYHLNDFLKYHDEEFINFAYRAILRRDPDSKGYEHYLANLRKGTLNKIEILGRLRYSPEGRNKNVKINGLSVPFMINYAYQAPLMGYPLRFAAALARLPRILKNMQTFESYTTAQFTHTASNINKNTAELESRLQNLHNSLSAKIDSEAAEMQMQAFEARKEDKKDIDALTDAVAAINLTKADKANIDAIQVILHALAESRDKNELDMENLDEEISALQETLNIQGSTIERQTIDIQQGKMQSQRSLSELEKLQQELAALKINKADIASIKGLQEQLIKLDVNKPGVGELEEIMALIRILDEEKADSKRVDGIIEQLQKLTLDKAAAETVEEMRGAIERIMAGKAEIKSIEEINEQLMKLDMSKAEAGLVEELRGLIGELAAGKADLQTVEQIAAGKADGQRVEEIIEQLRKLGTEKAEVGLVEELRGLIGELAAGKADLQIVVDINHEIQDIVQQIRDHKLHILDQQRRLSLLLEEARKRLPRPISRKQIKNMLTEEDHLLDSLYASFEDRFRGTREDIKQRQQIYLPYIEQTNSGRQEAPVLDAGCGRGEWLELLKEKGYIARGIDINRVMVRQCLELGLDAVESDVLEFLRKQKPNSAGAITGFHIIEHLPFKTLIKFIDESLRVLRPGGVLILETPNPENIMVGACNFYTDPSHQKPIPSFSLQYFIEFRGFNAATVLRLHKNTEQKVDNAFLQNLLFGEQDYAVIGYKS